MSARVIKLAVVANLQKEVKKRNQLILCGLFQWHPVFGRTLYDGVSSFPEAGMSALSFLLSF